MVKVKVCGITNLEDALAAVEWGADALGFVLAPSPRQVDPEAVSRMVAQLPPFVAKVGVFVDHPLEEVKALMFYCGLDLAQLHGGEDADYCQALFPRAIKALRVGDTSVLEALPLYKVSAYLLDGPGSGQGFDWAIAREATRWGRIILAGGLTPENVAQAISLARPYAVDVASGVELSPGRKDHAKLRAFLKEVKNAL